MTEDCIFCKIAKGEIPSTVVYQDDEIYAFRDINPAAPTHVLIIPRQHVASSLNDVNATNAPLIGRLLHVAAQIAQSEKVAEKGYRVVANTNRDAGQSVFHLHFHLLGGRKMGWPPY